MISIIIPTYNRVDSLPKVLTRFVEFGKDLRLRCDLEFILLDDGSTDGTKDVVSKIAPNFPFKFNYLYRKNKGAAATRNEGVRLAQGDIVLFLDSDIIPTGDLLYEHYRFHIEYPKINFALRGESIFDLSCGDSVRCTSTSSLSNVNSAVLREVLWPEFITCNISLKRVYLLENEMFDESLENREDVELGYRLSKKGLRLFVSTKALGYHYHPVSLEKYFRYAESYGRALAKWVNKAPSLRMDLIAVGREQDYGFVSWRRPKYLITFSLRSLIVNRYMVNLLISIGKWFDSRRVRFAKVIFMQIYIYFHAVSFKKTLRTLKRGNK